MIICDRILDSFKLKKIKTYTHTSIHIHIQILYKCSLYIHQAYNFNKVESTYLSPSPLKNYLRSSRIAKKRNMNSEFK